MPLLIIQYLRTVFLAITLVLAANVARGLFFGDVVTDLAVVHVVSEALTSRTSSIEYFFCETTRLSTTATTASPVLVSTLATQPWRLELFTNTRSPTCTLNSQDVLGCVFRLVRDGQESPQPPTVKKVPYHSAQVRGEGLLQVLRQSGVFTVVDAIKVVMQMFRHYEGLDVFCANMCIYLF